MNDVPRGPWVVGCGLTLLGVLVVLLVVCPGDRSFTNAGSGEEPITPGVEASIDLEFGNPHPIPLEVSDVRVRVREVTAPNADDAPPCDVSDFTVVQVPRGAKISIPAGARRTLSGLGLGRPTWPGVALADRSVSPDGCQGASVVLAYSGSGSFGW